VSGTIANGDPYSEPAGAPAQRSGCVESKSKSDPDAQRVTDVIPDADPDSANR